MIIEILLLLVDGEVPDHVAELADDSSRFASYWADSELVSYLFSGDNFVRDKFFIVASVWISTKTHKEFGNFYCSSHCCAVKCCVALFISYVSFCTIFKQQAEYVIL